MLSNFAIIILCSSVVLSKSDKKHIWAYSNKSSAGQSNNQTDSNNHTVNFTPVAENDNNKNLVDIYSSLMPSENPSSRIKNPDTTLSVPAILASNGYDCETHTFVSQGYLVNIHRIPRPKNGAITPRATVILQHGLTDTSHTWTVNGQDKSLAYVLANAGYDVWMPNARGSVYGREHTVYKMDSKEFWNYSFHELGQYDIPAVIDYIQKVKGEDTKISYVCHSMGCTMLLCALSLRPEYNDKLSVGVMLSPGVFLSNMKFPFKTYIDLVRFNAAAAFRRHIYEIFPKGSIAKASSICIDFRGKVRSSCQKMVFQFLGEDKQQPNMTVFKNQLTLRDSISWKTVLHFIQMTYSGEFKQFDYGSSKLNKEVYGSDTPPEYDLKKANMNMTIFWSENDNLVNERDVYKLYKKLPNTTQLYKVPFAKFNHADYLWAKDAPTLVNDKVLDILQTAMRTE